MQQVHRALTSALRSVVATAELDASLSESQWQALFSASAREGVLAVVYDVVMGLTCELRPSRKLMLQWTLSVEAIERRSEQQFKVSAFLAERFAERILADTLCSRDQVFNRSGSAWRQRLRLARNNWSNGRKYHKIYRKKCYS